MSFEGDVSAWKKKLEEKASQVARKVGFDLHGRIVERTPVDTGRLRANNQLAIVNRPTEALDDTDTSGSSTRAAASQALGGYKLGDDIWIANNVEYAVPMEFGGSVQRPEGFFRVSIEDIKQAWPSIVHEVTR